jgi:hypothetical protein
MLISKDKFATVILDANKFDVVIEPVTEAAF